jgi:SagB-type dehydrogenase family enzyme
VEDRKHKSVRVRRARALQVFWNGPDPVFENFLTHAAISASPVAFPILCFFNDWRRPEAAAAYFPEYSPSSLKRAIRQLIANSLLLEEGTDVARHDDQVATEWAHWLPHGSFHFATRDIDYITPEQGRRAARGYLRKSPQPPFFKTYARVPRIRLAAPPPPDGEFLHALLSRKTHREFSRKPVTLDAISQLLYYSFGVTGYLKAPVYGFLPHTTSPSGGARHPIEPYLIALRVGGLRQGIYHYQTQRHTLELVHSGPMRNRVLQYAEGQKHVANAAAVLVMTAVFPRSMWKYRHARAYRVVLLDAGHVCQTFCLVASWLGLAPFCTAVMSEKRIERDLHVDGITESALYVAGVGMPLEGKARARSARILSTASL